MADSDRDRQTQTETDRDRQTQNEQERKDEIAEDVPEFRDIIRSVQMKWMLHCLNASKLSKEMRNPFIFCI